jgi:hypothetical protein
MSSKPSTPRCRSAERIDLHEGSIASVDTGPDAPASWIEEAQRREADVANGKVDFVSGEETLARLRGSLR